MLASFISDLVGRRVQLSRYTDGDFTSPINGTCRAVGATDKDVVIIVELVPDRVLPYNFQPGSAFPDLATSRSNDRPGPGALMVFKWGYEIAVRVVSDFEAKNDYYLWGLLPPVGEGG